MENFTIVGAPAPVKQKVVPIPPGVPPPLECLPEMKDELIVKNTIKALSPRLVAVHGPTGTGKSTVFPLAITHWSEQVRTGRRAKARIDHLHATKTNIGAAVV